ncbi:hypothetical protein K458DRAFT_249824, partial [Lentithecium fluviatile CBS 122367]
NSVTFKGAQVNSLLAHQFLGTLAQAAKTDWGWPDFTPWFSSEPAHQKAVDGYLDTIIGHFAEGGYARDNVFTFHFHTAAGMLDLSGCDDVGDVPNVRLQVIKEDSGPSESTEAPFILVAANSQPGPGPTATQEERIQSASPARSISALVIPVMQDDAIVVTSPFPDHAAWKGHNRTARMKRLFDSRARPRRRYILADALQMDDVDDVDHGLKDLIHGRAEREVKKLYAAFNGASQRLPHVKDGGAFVGEAGAWGCGAFSGNILVKTMCMMIAAGLIGVELRLSLMEQRRSDVELARALLEQRFTTANLWDLL